MPPHMRPHGPPGPGHRGPHGHHGPHGPHHRHALAHAFFKGVVAIQYVADPVRMRAEDPADVILPAINGVKSLLASVLAHGSSVKRVVITGSAGAVLTPTEVPRTFTEADWNETDVPEVKAKGKEANPLSVVRARGTLLEKAAWSFYDEHKATVGFDLVVLNVPFVFGPLLHASEAPEDLSEIMGRMSKVVNNPEKLVEKVHLWKTG